jgi:hypothetical protein
LQVISESKVIINDLNTWCHVEAILLSESRENLKNYIIICSRTYEASEITVITKCHCNLISCDVRVVYSVMVEGSLLFVWKYCLSSVRSVPGPTMAQAASYQTLTAQPRFNIISVCLRYTCKVDK